MFLYKVGEWLYAESYSIALYTTKNNSKVLLARMRMRVRARVFVKTLYHVI